MRPAAGAHFFDRLGRGLVNFLNCFAGKLLPLARLENAERERINFPGRSANAVSVVFHNEQDRQFSFFGETNRFEKIALTSGGIANRRNDDVLLAVQLNSPSHSARRKEL